MLRPFIGSLLIYLGLITEWMKVGFVKLVDVERSFQTLVSEVCDAIAETWSYDNFYDV
jgi:hypothetical protein